MDEVGTATVGGAGSWEGQHRKWKTMPSAANAGASALEAPQDRVSEVEQAEQCSELLHAEFKWLSRHEETRQDDGSFPFYS